MSRATLLLVALLAGCGAQVSPDQKHTTQSCVDTRDGERFEFSTTTARDGHWSPQDVCFTVTDTQGAVRTLCKTHEVFLKCKAK